MPSNARRRTLAALPAFALAALRPAHAQAPSRRPTPEDVEGPFYPVRFPADRDADLTVVAGRPKPSQGDRLHLAGRVLDTRGEPLARARVELWQCDATGHYHHVDGDTPGDPDFQGYGELLTDADGRYAFRTIRPVRYGTRPPHLHFKLAHPAARPLTTQLYIEGDESAEGSRLSTEARARRAALSIALAGSASAGYSASYDFVLRPARG